MSFGLGLSLLALSLCVGSGALALRCRHQRARWNLWLMLAWLTLLLLLMRGMELLLLSSPSLAVQGMPVGLHAASREPAGVGNSHGDAPSDERSALAAVLASEAPPQDKPKELGALRRARNISVIMPCFGHNAFVEEALASVVHQQYPPVEILIVDDGSEERCGAHAETVLKSRLAAPRRRQVLLLQHWWGWGAPELAHFKDEVLVTPNRGVAHARNTGIRRARGDWICCLDGDDMIADTYFLKAMARVAAVPGTNLVYANQQFFGESRWQWNVPLFKADSALTNGPFPLMTLFTKELWRATPYGFDEALPKGHEDWAFWLQLSRLPLQTHKLEEFLTMYRFKKNSKMRNREKFNPEVPRLLRGLFPDLYPIRKLLVDHYSLTKPRGITEAVVMDISVSEHLFPRRAVPHLWRGFVLEAKGDLAAAAEAYNRSRALASPADWQGSYRLWRVLRQLKGAEAEAAAEGRALEARWGREQFRWYASDVDGEVLEHEANE